MKKTTRTTLEITATHLKFMQARPEREVIACGVKDIQGLPPEELPAVLKSEFRPGPDPNTLLLAIFPRRLVVLKNLRLPSHDAEELRRMVGLQVIKLVPFPREEIVFDYQLVAREPDGYSRVLVAIVQKEEVYKYLGLFREAGITPDRLAVSSFGLQSWLNHFLARRRLPAGESTAVLDFHSGHTEIAIGAGGRLLFSRFFPYGLKELAAGAVDEVREQIRLTFTAFYKEQLGDVIRRIVVTSASPPVQGIKEKCEEVFQVPVETVAATEGFPLSREPAGRLTEDFPEVAFAGHLGFLWADAGQEIDLLPSEVLAHRRTRGRKRELVRLGIQVALVFVLAFAAFQVDTVFKAAYLKRLEEKLAGQRKEARQAEEKIGFLRFITGHARDRLLLADIIEDVYILTPGEITFQSLQMDTSGTFFIQGYADSGTTVNEFQNTLVNSSLFKDVTLQYATKRKRFQEEFTEFKLSLKRVTPEVKADD